MRPDRPNLYLRMLAVARTRQRSRELLLKRMMAAHWRLLKGLLMASERRGLLRDRTFSPERRLSANDRTTRVGKRTLSCHSRLIFGREEVFMFCLFEYCYCLQPRNSQQSSFLPGEVLATGSPANPKPCTFPLLPFLPDFSLATSKCSWYF